MGDDVSAAPQGVEEGAPGPDGGLRRKVDASHLWSATAKRRGDSWRYFLYGFRPQPVPSFRGPVEEPDAERIGVCCSGGGIRSAAFNLGALQALRARGELARAKYLSAVSGGSYIASAFATVERSWQWDGVGEPARPDDDRDNPQNGYDDSNPKLLAEISAFAPGSPEEQYLRNRSTYLAPALLDKVYLLYRVILGIAFNVTFLALPLFGLGMLLGVFVYRPALPHLVGACGTHCSATLPGYLWIPPVAVVGASAALGTAALLIRSRTDAWSRALDTWSMRLLLAAVALGWCMVALPLIVAAVTGASQAGVGAGESGAVGGGGLTGVLVGVLVYLRELRADPAKAVGDVKEGVERIAKLSARARNVLAYVVGALVGPALLLSAMVLGASLALAQSRPHTLDGSLVLAGVGAIAVFFAVYFAVDLTSWSLHPFYKRRLATAFALKRVKPSQQVGSEEGVGLHVIPQDETRGIAVERDFNRRVPLSTTAMERDDFPTLLVCASANISDIGATPPGRSVTSFTFSAYTVGGPLVGGIETAEFEDAFSNGRSRRQRDLTLSAAVAMSGAALSPSMGKMTRRPYTFLMAIANIRLGVWVPNPRWVRRREVADRKSLGRTRSTLTRLTFGRARPSYLIRELFGFNHVDAKFLYVSDGGHYENLGLVELLRRGCAKIYCFDAGGGQGFDGIGDAIALARSELEVEITLDTSPLKLNADGVAAAPIAKGAIKYADGTKGHLIYARNVMTDAAPVDVKAYHETDESFPHDSTIQQLYTDQRFESYRVLGRLAGIAAADAMP